MAQNTVSHKTNSPPMPCGAAAGGCEGPKGGHATTVATSISHCGTDVKVLPLDGFCRLPNAVLLRAADYGMKPRHWLVLVGLLARCWDGATECWPSVKTLAAVTGLPERSLRRALRELSELGVICTTRRQRDPTDGMISGNTYRLTILEDVRRWSETPAAANRGKKLGLPLRGFTEIPNSLIRHFRDLGAKTADFPWLVAVLAYHGPGRCQFSHRRIGHLLGVSPDRAKQAVTTLRDRGLLVRLLLRRGDSGRLAPSGWVPVFLHLLPQIGGPTPRLYDHRGFLLKYHRDAEPDPTDPCGDVLGLLCFDGDAAAWWERHAELVADGIVRPVQNSPAALDRGERMAAGGSKMVSGRISPEPPSETPETRLETPPTGGSGWPVDRGERMAAEVDVKTLKEKRHEDAALHAARGGIIIPLEDDGNGRDQDHGALSSEGLKRLMAEAEKDGEKRRQQEAKQIRDWEPAYQALLQKHAEDVAAGRGIVWRDGRTARGKLLPPHYYPIGGRLREELAEARRDIADSLGQCREGTTDGRVPYLQLV